MNSKLYGFSFSFSDFIFYLCSAFHFRPRQGNLPYQCGGLFYARPISPIWRFRTPM